MRVSRVERRMVKQRKRRGAMQKVLLFLSALVIASGIASRLGQGNVLQVSGIAPPTPTPISAAFDETVEQREITLPEVVWYAIQTGIYTDLSAAQTRAGDYSDRGAPGVVVADGDKWRVLIACFRSHEDAASVRERLSEKQGVDTYLHTWLCPELKLRMTGMAGQLDIAEAGLTQMLQVAEQLRDASTALDTGGMNASEVQALLKDIKARLDVWEDTAARRFGKRYPPLLAQEMALVTAWKAHQSAIELAAKQGATELSAALKTKAMVIYQSVIELRNSVSTS